MVDILSVIQGMSAITTILDSIKEALSSLRKKTKNGQEVSEIEANIHKMNQKLNSIRDGAWSINAYFELYGNALDLYTTADDFTKTLLRGQKKLLNLLRRQIIITWYRSSILELAHSYRHIARI